MTTTPSLLRVQGITHIILYWPIGKKTESGEYQGMPEHNAEVMTAYISNLNSSIFHWPDSSTIVPIFAQIPYELLRIWKDPGFAAPNGLDTAAWVEEAGRRLYAYASILAGHSLVSPVVSGLLAGISSMSLVGWLPKMSITVGFERLTSRT